jgi:hypothetical protein
MNTPSSSSQPAYSARGVALARQRALAAGGNRVLRGGAAAAFADAAGLDGAARLREALRLTQVARMSYGAAHNVCTFPCSEMIRKRVSWPFFIIETCVKRVCETCICLAGPLTRSGARRCSSGMVARGIWCKTTGGLTPHTSR